MVESVFCPAACFWDGDCVSSIPKKVPRALSCSSFRREEMDGDFVFAPNMLLLLLLLALFLDLLAADVFAVLIWSTRVPKPQADLPYLNTVIYH